MGLSTKARMILFHRKVVRNDSVEISWSLRIRPICKLRFLYLRVKGADNVYFTEIVWTLSLLNQLCNVHHCIHFAKETSQRIHMTSNVRILFYLSRKLPKKTFWPNIFRTGKNHLKTLTNNNNKAQLFFFSF